MNLSKFKNSPQVNIKKQAQTITSEQQLTQAKAKESNNQEPTFGQKLADGMAAKVGSWAFLISQTSVLALWVGANSIPGLPHWDEQPFILLNLVFSFASAYTAPIVLMSQNRQSDEDRKHAHQNYGVNVQTAHNLELLHEKFDRLYSQKFAELTEIVKQQSASNNQVVSPARQSVKKEVNVSLVPSLHYEANTQFFKADKVQKQNEFFEPMFKSNLDNHTSGNN